MNSEHSEHSEHSKLKSRLPAKYNQLFVFTYWLLNQMKSKNTITDDVYNEYIETFHIYGNIPEQIDYLNNFMDEFKMIDKHLKKEIREKKKPPKVSKKKEKDPDAPKPKRGRKKKAIIDTRTPEEKLIDEIVAQAQCNPCETETESASGPINVSTIGIQKVKRTKNPKCHYSTVIDDDTKKDIVQQIVTKANRT